MNVRWAGACVAALVLWGSTGAAWAQEPAIGQRVRLTGSAVGSRERGEVLEAGPDTLVVRLDGRDAPIRVDRLALTRLELSRGRHGDFREGFLYGFVPGAVLGGWMGYHLMCLENPCSRLQGVLIWGAWWGAKSGLLFGLIGSLWKTERWERVPTVTPRIQLGVVPGPRSVQFVARF